MKAGMFLSFLVFATPAVAGDYTYYVSTGFDAGAHDWITTNCDNCALRASNIVGWSLSQTFVPPSDFGGPLITASSLAHSLAYIQGAAFVAKPTGLFFDFNPGATFGSVVFTSGGNSVQFTNTPDLADGTGATDYCSEKRSVCFGSSVEGIQQMGTRAKATAAPELGGVGALPVVTILLGIGAILSGRRRALRSVSGS